MGCAGDRQDGQAAPQRVPAPRRPAAGQAGRPAARPAGGTASGPVPGRRRLAFIAVLFLAVLFLAGLVLPVWWLTGSPPLGLPGLGAYPSAYLGDSLLLPAGCVVIMTGIRSLRPARAEPLAAAVAAAVALVSSVAVQAEWLEDPTTQPNWTMPHTGHFDAAGWWHAAYFTGMSMVLVVLTAVFLARVRASRRAGEAAAVRAVSSGTGAVTLLTAWGSYAVLAVHDDFSGSVGSSSSISSFLLVAAVLLLAAGLTAAAYGRLAQVLARPALLAAAGTGLTGTLASAPAPIRIALAAATAGVAGAAVLRWYRLRRPRAADGRRSHSALPRSPGAAGRRAGFAGGAASDGPATAPAHPRT